MTDKLENGLSSPGPIVLQMRNNLGRPTSKSTSYNTNSLIGKMAAQVFFNKLNPSD